MLPIGGIKMSGQNQTNEELSAELAMLYSNLITAVISVYGDSESAKGYISSMTNEIKELIVVLAVLTNNSRGYVLADYLLDDMCHWNKNIKHITFSELKSEMEKNFSDPERNYIDVFCGCINLGCVEGLKSYAVVKYFRMLIAVCRVFEVVSFSNNFKLLNCQVKCNRVSWKTS